MDDRIIQALNDLDLGSLTQEDVDTITNPVMKDVLQSVINSRSADGPGTQAHEDHLMYSKTITGGR
jgi:hypothetical protein